MKKLLIPIAAVAVLMLTSCKENASDTAKDVAKAQEEAAQKVDAARKDADKTAAKANEQVADAKADYAKTEAGAQKVLSKAESEAMIKTAHADFDVAIAEAEGRNKVAKEKCDALKGVDKDACLSAAEALSRPTRRRPPPSATRPSWQPNTTSKHRSRTRTAVAPHCACRARLNAGPKTGRSKGLGLGAPVGHPVRWPVRREYPELRDGARNFPFLVCAPHGSRRSATFVAG
jgi:hypothetical protein